MEQLNNLKKLNDDIIRLSSRINKETSINKEQQKSYIISFFNKLDKQLDKPIEDVINLIIKEGNFIEINEFIQDINRSIDAHNYTFNVKRNKIENKTQLIEYFKKEYSGNMYQLFTEPLMYLMAWKNTYKGFDFYARLSSVITKILKKNSLYKII